MRAPATRSPAPQPAGRSPAPKPQVKPNQAGIVNLRPEAVAQRKLAEFIRTSPRIVAQAKREAALREEPAQCVETSVSRHLPHAEDQAGMEDDESLQLKQASSPLQRLKSEDEALQKQSAASSVQHAAPEEEEPIQRMVAEEEPPAQLKETSPRSSNQTGMPDRLKAGIESLSGLDMSDVRVHSNSAQPAQLNALAYAQGNDIHLAPGQEKHLPHEAWHVVQQRQGRVKPTLQLNGEPINDEPGLEKEADAMGTKGAMAHKIPEGSVQRKKLRELSGEATGPIQRALHPETKRVIESEKTDWKTLLESNAFSKGDIDKIAALPTNCTALKQAFDQLIETDSEIDDLGNELSQSAKTARKNKIKSRIEGLYLHILDFAANKLAEAKVAYDTCVNKGADAVRTFKATLDRKWEDGKPYPAGSPLLKHEKIGVVRTLIDAEYKVIGWGTVDGFRKAVMQRFVDGNVALSQLGQVDSDSLATEKAFVNAQLTAWQTVAINAQGLNADGTWGTSSTGSGANFKVSKVNPAVWAKLRQWWTGKKWAFVTASETSNWSLKMDRVPPDDAFSPRFNYHINVG